MATASITSALDSIAKELDAKLCGKSFVRLEQSGHILNQTPRAALCLREPLCLSLYQPGDDLRLICFANNSPSTFWQFIAEIKEDEELAAKARQSSWEAGEIENYLFMVTSDGVRIHLSFCQHPKPLAMDDYQNDTYDISNVYGISLRTKARFHDANDALDAQAILAIREDSALQDLYETLHRWATTSRLISTRWSVFNVRDIFWMLLALRPQSIILEHFLDKFKNEQDAHAVETTSGRSIVFDPPSNSILFVDAMSQLRRKVTSVDSTYDDYYLAFLSAYDLYVVVSGECYDERARDAFNSTMDETAESIRRCAVDTALVRIWPDRLTVKEHGIDQAHYILGLRASSEADKLRLHEHSLRWLSRQDGVHNSEFGIRVHETPLSSTEIKQRFSASTPVSPSSDQPRQEVGRRSPSEASSARFRSARQVLSRLQHDETHTNTGYEVGYLDRFQGLKWKRIEDFSKPTEDEDFIPEHRIKQVRRKIDHAIIWNRGAKLDLT